MYASIRRYVVHRESVDEIAGRISEGFVPVIRDIPGFVAYYVVDTGTGIAISISIFDNQAGAEQSAAAARDHIKENLASLFPNLPEIMDGQVIVKAP
jgi:hypothetical protein